MSAVSALSRPLALPVRRSRRACRCAAVVPAAPPASSPPAIVAPAPRLQQKDFAALSAPSPLWTVADAAAAPAVSTPVDSSLPEGTSWRYSEFINAVTKGKVERVRFSKDGSALQLTAVDGCVPCTEPLSRGSGPPRPPVAPRALTRSALSAAVRLWCCPTTRTWWTSWPRTGWTSPCLRATSRATTCPSWATCSSRCLPLAACSSCSGGLRRVLTTRQRAPLAQRPKPQALARPPSLAPSNHTRALKLCHNAAHHTPSPRAGALASGRTH